MQNLDELLDSGGWTITKNVDNGIKVAPCTEDSILHDKNSRDWLTVPCEKNPTLHTFDRYLKKCPKFLINDLLTCEENGNIFRCRGVIFREVYIHGIVVNYYTTKNKLSITLDDGSGQIVCVITNSENLDSLREDNLKLLKSLSDDPETLSTEEGTKFGNFDNACDVALKIRDNEKFNVCDNPKIKTCDSAKFKTCDNAKLKPKLDPLAIEVNAMNSFYMAATLAANNAKRILDNVLDAGNIKGGENVAVVGTLKKYEDRHYVFVNKMKKFSSDDCDANEAHYNEVFYNYENVYDDNLKV